ATSTTQVNKVYQEAITSTTTTGNTSVNKVFQEVVTGLDTGNLPSTRINKVWMEAITDPPLIIKRRLISVYIG
ncbi:hypothetical protein ACQX7T_15520, partial [Staphylococcus aureus]